MPNPSLATPAPVARDPGRLVNAAKWRERMPHEATLEIEFVEAATKPVFERSGRRFERRLARKGFRKGARHLPRAYVAERWAPIEEGLVAGFVRDALDLLSDRLGAKLLDPLPEILEAGDPLGNEPWTVQARLRLVPAPPDPLAADVIWPPDPMEAALALAGGSSGALAPVRPGAPSTHGAPHSVHLGGDHEHPRPTHH